MTVSYFRVMIYVFMLLNLYYLIDLYFIENNLPEMVISYYQWWMALPLTSSQKFMLEYGFFIHILFLLSIVGIAFLWSSARYIYVGFLFILIISEILGPAPLIVIGRHMMLGNIISVMSGMIGYAIFFTPLSEQFSNNKGKGKGKGLVKNRV